MYSLAAKGVSMPLKCLRKASTAAVSSTSQTSFSPVIRMRSSEKGKITNFDASQGSVLKWYACGPTVYEHSHIGHARAYVQADIIRRVFTHFFGIQVYFALGITDVDDKIIQRLEGNGKLRDMLSMTKEYEISFFEDMKRLNVMPPTVVLRVSEHIPDIIAYINEIISAGKAYEIEGDVYFDVAQCEENYGRFGALPAPDLRNTDEGDAPKSLILKRKRYHRDFALWKAGREGEPGWESPWGRGRPGWHIECSAMTHAIFGSQLDIHSGGVDLKFPHHTNEIAQW